ncbi:MAG: TetR family transcriptional regulator [Hamadaea sp.]|uniref:acyl-CoA-like ligand-binding transcription factor n=1 Tax=Hamadaea sp. TaxID=2024425 RepID=UPI0017AA2CF6|nr:TetR family transcriptional regulator [Hamadaea sp.]NUT21813.1 TetR family transcriptional regulator [Hamadaea sp.]
MGLRERKKIETRAALSWAAIQLVVERGFDNVLVEDIANAAGVSPRTFNNYFSSKAEAVTARHLDRAVKLAEILRERPADEPLWTAIRKAVLAQLEPGPEVLDHPVGDRERWATGVRSMMAAPALQAEFLRASSIAEAEVAAAVAERTKTAVGRDLYPSLVAAAVSAAVTVCQQQYLHDDAQTDMAVLLTEALDLVEAGLPDPSA